MQEKFYKGLEIDFYKRLVTLAQRRMVAKNEKDKDKEDHLINELKAEALKALQPSIIFATPGGNLKGLRGATLEQIAKLPEELRVPSRVISSPPSNRKGTSDEDKSSGTSENWEKYTRAYNEFDDALTRCAIDMIHVAEDSRVQPTTYTKVVHTLRDVLTAFAALLATCCIGFLFKSNNKVLGYVITPERSMKTLTLLASVSGLGALMTRLDADQERESEQALMVVIRGEGQNTFDPVKTTCEKLIGALAVANPGRSGCF